MLLALLASLAWMAISSGLILLNKQLLSHGFGFPMALSALGMVFSAVASFFVCRVRTVSVLAEALIALGIVLGAVASSFVCRVSAQRGAVSVFAMGT